MAKTIVKITKDNVSEIIHLSCISECFKTVSGHLRYKGTFECKRRYAQENDWLVEVTEEKWRCIPDAEYQRIKNKL